MFFVFLTSIGFAFFAAQAMDQTGSFGMVQEFNPLGKSTVICDEAKPETFTIIFLIIKAINY